MSSLWRTTIKGSCPHCGAASIFSGWYQRRDKCPACGLVYAGEDSADGPTYIAIVITGFLVTVAAFFVEIVFQPPYWVHAILWFPLVMILSFLVLRFSKAFFIAIEYRNKIGIYQQKEKANTKGVDV